MFDDVLAGGTSRRAALALGAVEDALAGVEQVAEPGPDLGRFFRSDFTAGLQQGVHFVDQGLQLGNGLALDVGDGVMVARGE
ncbi:hypothetical protein D9M70_627250 [compost metagenome]